MKLKKKMLKFIKENFFDIFTKKSAHLSLNSVFSNKAGVCTPLAADKRTVFYMVK